MSRFAAGRGAGVQNAFAVLRLQQVGGLLCAPILHGNAAFGKLRQLLHGHGFVQADGVIVQYFGFDAGLLQQRGIAFCVAVPAVHAQGERRVHLEGGGNVVPVFRILLLQAAFEPGGQVVFGGFVKPCGFVQAFAFAQEAAQYRVGEGTVLPAPDFADVAHCFVHHGIRCVARVV